MKDKIIEYLHKNEWISISTLARNAGINEKGLANFVNGTRELPKKHIKPLHDYLLENSYAALIGEIQQVNIPTMQAETPISDDAYTETWEKPSWQTKLASQLQAQKHQHILEEAEEAEEEEAEEENLSPHQWIERRNECVSVDEHNKWKKALEKSSISPKIKKEILATGIV